MADLNVDYYDLYQFSDKFFEVCNDLKDTQSQVNLTYVKVEFATPIELCSKAGRSLRDIAGILETDERVLTNLYPADYKPPFLPFNINTPVDIYLQDWEDWLNNHELGHAIVKRFSAVASIGKAFFDILEDPTPLGAAAAIVDIIQGVGDSFSSRVDLFDVLVGNGFNDRDIFWEIGMSSAKALDDLQDNLGLDYQINFERIVDGFQWSWDRTKETVHPFETAIKHLDEHVISEIM